MIRKISAFMSIIMLLSICTTIGYKKVEAATLSNINLSAGKLVQKNDPTKGFDPTVTTYTDIVSNDVSSITVTPSLSSSGVFNYGLFSGTDLDLSGDNLNVYAKVHINRNLSWNGQAGNFTQTTEVGGNVTNSFPNLVHSTSFPTPYANISNPSSSNRILIGTLPDTLNGDYYCNGDLYVSGNINGVGTVVVNGSIYFKNINMSNDSFVTFYAKNDINYSGNSDNFNGVLYSPNGTISKSGGSMTFNGVLVANSFDLRGSGSNGDIINYDSRASNINLATITVNGKSLVSGQSLPVNLNIGINTITVVITDLDGTSSSYNISVIRAPAKPIGLSANATTQTSSILSWTASSGATSYNVYQGNVKIATGVTGTNYTVTGLTPGTGYTFTVTAVNSGGESDRSNQVSVTTLSNVPEAPTLSASGTTQTTTNLSWTSSNGATSYNVYQGSTQIATGITGTSYPVTGLTPGTGYTYTVTAVNSGGESAKSNQVSVTTLSNVPEAPTLSASGTTQTTTNLSWTSSNGATSYNMYQGSTQIATGITGTSYTVTGLTPGTNYNFTVTAVDSGGESAKSNQVSVTTLIETVEPQFSLEQLKDGNGNAAGILGVYAVFQLRLTQDQQKTITDDTVWYKYDPTIKDYVQFYTGKISSDSGDALKKVIFTLDRVPDQNGVLTDSFVIPQNVMVKAVTNGKETVVKTPVVFPGSTNLVLDNSGISFKFDMNSNLSTGGNRAAKIVIKYNIKVPDGVDVNNVSASYVIKDENAPPGVYALSGDLKNDGINNDSTPTIKYIKSSSGYTENYLLQATVSFTPVFEGQSLTPVTILSNPEPVTVVSREKLQ